MDRKANPRLYDEIQDTEGLSSVRTSGKLGMCNKYVEKSQIRKEQQITQCFLNQYRIMVYDEKCNMKC